MVTAPEIAPTLRSDFEKVLVVHYWKISGDTPSKRGKVEQRHTLRYYFSSRDIGFSEQLLASCLKTGHSLIPADGIHGNRMQNNG